MTISFKRKLHRRDLLIGSIVTLPSLEISEILSRQGFDWLLVDLEHSALTIREAQSILQTVTPGTPCVIRIPANDETWVKKCLDIGADGIIIPHILTVEDAVRGVTFCKYPLDGSRSIGIGRAQGYGFDFQDYISSADEDIAVILQVEHIDAVRNMTSILNLPGIDGLFIGPYDLSASMGKTGLTTDPEVQKAIFDVKQHADETGMPMGIFGVGGEVIKPYIETGYTLIAVGIDTMIFQEAAAKILRTLKP
ncbi:MAG: aldolase/citrate lyase family protein [Deltaproteobacteria bacterium]